MTNNTTSNTTNNTTWLERNWWIIVILLLLCVVLFVAIRQCNANNNKNNFSPLQNDSIQRNNKDSLTDYVVDVLTLAEPLHNNEANIIRHKAYSLSYNEQHEQANWVAYMLTGEQVKYEATDRHKGKFMPDPKVPTGSATHEDYTKSGYDRGHLLPAEDMDHGEVEMVETFYCSNISPQTPQLNRGQWQQLEKQVRNWAIQHDTIWVVTGPILTDEITHFIGRTNKVSVPKRFYKIILFRKNAHNYSAYAFLIPNTQIESYKNYNVSIDEIEEAAQIDFYPALPDEIETVVEQSVNTHFY